MEFLPVQILEENDACKKLVNQHIYSIKDLQALLNSKAEGGHALSKEVEKILEEKVSNICKAVKEGVDLPRANAYVEKFHSFPNIVITLNGINLVCGKRGTGKTTFAFSQMVDSFVEVNAKAIKQYLNGTINKDDFLLLGNLKIVIFCLRDVFYLSHFNGIIEEKGRKFVEKSFGGLSPSTAEEYSGRFTEFIRHILMLIRINTLEESKGVLSQMLRIGEVGNNADFFGVILDDISFIFNRIDSLTIKSDVRNFSKILNQLIRQNNMPIIVTDSVRGFYEEDSLEEIKIFTPSILFSSISDIFYLTRTDTMFKVSQAKSSREVISIDR